jgi:predicted O-methyltransferase YrrM
MAVAMYSEELDRYLTEHLPERPAVVLEMEDHARELRFPIIGPAVGRLLQLLAMTSGARRVFEMGSGYGYSAYWFLSGMPGGGRVVLTDGSATNREAAARNLDALGFAGRYDYHVGAAQDALRAAQGSFDIVYNDIDKEQYPETIDLVAEKLRPGGLFITDNVLWSARVADATDRSHATEAIREFNRRLAGDPRFATSFVPIRDGLAVAVRM